MEKRSLSLHSYPPRRGGSGGGGAIYMEIGYGGFQGVMGSFDSRAAVLMHSVHGDRVWWFSRGCGRI